MTPRPTDPRPLIGIIACNRDLGPEPAVTVMRRYVEAAVRYADCAALIVPSLPGVMRAAEVTGRLDGLVLTGSPSNLDPARYGDDSPDPPGPFDRERDTMAADLIAAMLDAAKPVLGICRGFQELNVAFGGSLRRDLGAVARPHHAADGADLAATFGHRHAVALTPGGRLAAAYGVPELTVNSVHYQGVGRLGAGLAVEAVAADGVVEAFTAPNVLGVQWHPEWATAADPDAQALLAVFGAMVRTA